MNCIICKNYGDCPVEREVYGRDYKFESNGLNGVECAEYKQDYITPEQYEKRTGREWPDNAAVYSRAKNTNGGHHGKVCVCSVLLKGKFTEEIISLKATG